ncbi:hypothetical protein BH09ACT11_BH09ACT11_07560 [soil metagenome]
METYTVPVNFVEDGDVTPIVNDLVDADGAYYYHYDSCTLPWSKAPRVNGHLKIWFAKTAHGSYPANAIPPTYTRFGYDYKDKISGSGSQVWYGNPNGVLRNARDQAWYQFGGAWGDKYGSLGAQWGPIGPNYYHGNTPPTFSSKTCKMS